MRSIPDGAKFAFSRRLRALSRGPSILLERRPGRPLALYG